MNKRKAIEEVRRNYLLFKNLIFTLFLLFRLHDVNKKQNELIYEEH